MATHSSGACACAISPGPSTTASTPASLNTAASVQNIRSSGRSMRAPSQRRNAARSRVAKGELSSVHSSFAGGTICRTSVSSSALSAAMSAPGGGRSETIRCASSGTTLKATPPSSLATLRHMPSNPAGPFPTCARPQSSSATASRANSASGRGSRSARDECPPSPRRRASSVAMPRWRVPARSPVGSHTMAYVTPCSAPDESSARRQVPSRSSSPEKTMTVSRGCASSSAHRIDAMAPLVSQAPSPIRRWPSTRAKNGSPLHPALTGTVSRWAFTSRRGRPQRAVTYAPACESGRGTFTTRTSSAAARAARPPGARPAPARRHPGCRYGRRSAETAA